MNVLTKAKEKILKSSVADKATKFATAVSAGGIGMGLMSIGSSAIDLGATITSATAIDEIASGVKDFIEPAIIIMCAVAGIRLGMRLLRGATH